MNISAAPRIDALVIPDGSPIRVDDAWNQTSQFGEDGLIASAVRRYLPGLDPDEALCFECGCSDGEWYSNTKRLRDQGWSAVLVECDPVAFEACRDKFQNDRVQVLHLTLDQKITVDHILQERHCHVCVLDIDGGEDAIWRGMTSHPDLVLIEFNPYDGPEVEAKESRYGQCGLYPLIELGRSKGYRLIAATFCNALFVSNHLT